MRGSRCDYSAHNWVYINDESIPVLQEGDDVLKSQKGSTLLIVIMVFFVLMIFGSIVLTLAMSETKIVSAQQQQLKEQNAARSGAEAMASYLIGNVATDTNLTHEMINKTTIKGYTGTVDGVSFEVKVSGTPNSGTQRYRTPIITAMSFVEVSGTKKYLKSVKLQLRERNLFKGAIFADGNFNIGNNELITGDIGTNSNTINFGSNDIVGNVLLGPGASDAYVNQVGLNNVTTGHTAEKITEIVGLSPIAFNLFPSTATPMSAFSNVFAGPGPGNVTYMTTDTLNRAYEIEGSGEIHVLVTNSINFNGADSITKAFPGWGDARLYIYYNGTSAVNFSGQADYFCAVFAPNATVNFNGGGNGTFNGSIVCKNYSGGNSHIKIIHDPGLNMDSMAITGVGSYIRGIYTE